MSQNCHYGRLVVIVIAAAVVLIHGQGQYGNEEEDECDADHRSESARHCREIVDRRS